MAAVRDAVRALQALVLLGLAGAACAADCPPPPCFVRPTTLVVSFAPGGQADALARTLAAKLTNSLGQSVIVDNRPGEAGSMAAAYVAKAAPDGYTVLFTSLAPLAINRHLFTSMPFDASRDLASVGLYAAVPQVVTVHPSVPANSIAELIALAKQRPGGMSYASSGKGSSSHLAAEQLKLMAGINLSHVPYKGTGPAMVDMQAGQVQLMISDLGAALPAIKTGRLKALAVTSSKRSTAASQLPTVAEAGVQGYESVTSYGLLLPARTDPSIIGRLNTEMRKVLALPDVRERFAIEGVEAGGGSPEDFARHIRSESARWAKVIRAAGIRAE